MTYCASPWQHSPVESMLHCLRMCFIPSYWLSDTTPVALYSLTMDELSDAVSISSLEDNVHRRHKKAFDKKIKSRAGSDANDPSLHFTVMTKAFQVWMMCQPLAAHRSQQKKVLSSRLLVLHRKQRRTQMKWLEKWHPLGR